MSDAPPVAVPLLHPCIRCGCPVQSGGGPGDLVWHDCEWVEELRARTLPPPPPPPTGFGPLLDKITQVIHARADKLTGRELSDIIDSMARLRDAEAKHGGTTQAGTSRQLLAFLADDEDEAHG